MAGSDRPAAAAVTVTGVDRSTVTAYGRPMPSTFESLVVDAADPRALARFWSEVLAWPITAEDDEEVEVAPPDGHAATPLLFVLVPDDKGAKNRLHLDLRPDDQAAEVERIVALGARRVDVGQGDVSWVVLADPEGNEFCVLSGR
jgi:predicted enzyme related to lactoylglutathione lyase